LRTPSNPDWPGDEPGTGFQSQKENRKIRGHVLAGTRFGEGTQSGQVGGTVKQENTFTYKKSLEGPQTRSIGVEDGWEVGHLEIKTRGGGGKKKREEEANLSKGQPRERVQERFKGESIYSLKGTQLWLLKRHAQFPLREEYIPNHFFKTTWIRMSKRISELTDHSGGKSLTGVLTPKNDEGAKTLRKRQTLNLTPSANPS